MEFYISNALPINKNKVDGHLGKVKYQHRTNPRVLGLGQGDTTHSILKGISLTNTWTESQENPAFDTDYFIRLHPTDLCSKDMCKAWDMHGEVGGCGGGGGGITETSPKFKILHFIFQNGREDLGGPTLRLLQSCAPLNMAVRARCHRRSIVALLFTESMYKEYAHPMFCGTWLHGTSLSTAQL